MAHFAGIGLGATLAPGILWARMQDADAKKVTLAMVAEAMKLSGLEFTEEELKSMVDAANQNLARYEDQRAIHIPNDVSPPFHFSALVPGMVINRVRLPFRLSAAAGREATGPSRGGRVLAGPPSGGARSNEAGHGRRADRRCISPASTATTPR